jgi:hypothetical protein
MPEKTNWKENLLEDAVVIVGLLVLGLVMVAIKLVPPVVRWATKR